MHPIERLRYVARSHGGDQRLLVRETAGALSGLGLDPPAGDHQPGRVQPETAQRTGGLAHQQALVAAV